MPILAQLASDDVLDSAHEWLCRRRRDYSPNADVWAFRRDWPREKEQIKADLLSGNYRFSLLTRITLNDGEDTDLWSARDALVLKALAMVLGKHLPSRNAAPTSRATAAQNMLCGRSTTISPATASCYAPR
jgi:hypothetical protein